MLRPRPQPGGQLQLRSRPTMLLLLPGPRPPLPPQSSRPIPTGGLWYSMIPCAIIASAIGINVPIALAVVSSQEEPTTSVFHQVQEQAQALVLSVGPWTPRTSATSPLRCR